ncbi:MAG: outer membrane beta-barrel protein [Cyclobacteriaceae bacterium]
MGAPKFEESWREAFAGAESDVPDAVWSRIEFDLVMAESRGTRSKLVFYRRLAAGIAVFAVALASYVTYHTVSDQSNTQLALEKTLPSASDNKTNSELQAQDKTQPGESTADLTNGLNAFANSSTSSPGQIAAVQSLAAHTTQPTQPSLEAEAESKRSMNFKRSILTSILPSIPSPDAQIKSTEFYQPNFPRRLPAMPSYFMTSNKESNKSETLWASIGMGGGSYDPGSVQTTSPVALLVDDPASLSSQQPQSSQESIGAAYSVGAQIGTMLTRRLVLQTGLAYLVQRIDYTSNYSNLASNNKLSASVAEYAAPGQNVAYVSPYEVRSSNEYVSVPLQLGYRIIERKFGLQVNTGVATDVFIKNTLRDKSGQTEKFTQTAGENSPYRNINFTGLAGLELSHKIGNNYRLAVTPGLRYTFNSILKDDATLAYNPLVLEVGMKFKYIFN